MAAPVIWADPHRIGGGSTRVERRCPRCGGHAMHHSSPRDVRRTLIHGDTPGIVLLSMAADIICTKCGHHWVGRYKRDEV